MSGQTDEERMREIEALKAALTKAREALEEIREIHCNQEGFIPKTCPEGYLQQEMKKMYLVAVKALTAINFTGGYVVDHLKKRDAAIRKEEREKTARECAKLAKDFSWELPVFKKKCCNNASDDAACAVGEQISEAIKQKFGG